MVGVTSPKNQRYKGCPVPAPKERDALRDYDRPLQAALAGTASKNMVRDFGAGSVLELRRIGRHPAAARESVNALVMIP